MARACDVRPVAASMTSGHAVLQIKEVLTQELAHGWQWPEHAMSCGRQ